MDDLGSIEPTTLPYMLTKPDDFSQIIVNCLLSDPDKRPKIDDVIASLQDIQIQPTIPPKDGTTMSVQAVDDLRAPLSGSHDPKPTASG